MRSKGALVAMTVFALALPSDRVAGQDTIPAPPTFVLAGQIVDGLTETPVISAVIKVPQLRRYVFSDVNGRFAFPDFPEGTWEIVVEMLGYHTLDGSVTVSEGNGLLLRLNPDPIALEGLRVRTRADGLFEERRRSYPFRVTNISPQDIANAINPDPAFIFRRNANSHVTSCSINSSELTLAGCYYRRGKLLPVRVFLDEGPLLGGMQELAMFPAAHLHSMDWLRDTGELHVYTKVFVERLSDSRMRLMPFKWPFGSQ